VSWLETVSPSFTARHEQRDGDDAVAVLELLEGTRERLLGAFTAIPEEIAVVLHGSELQLKLAQPMLPVVRALTAPSMRRYQVGWFTRREVHVLAPRLLEPRASAVAGSREMVMLAPAVLYAALVVGTINPGLIPPFRPPHAIRTLRWAWLAAGAAQYFAGQVQFARPAIARRLREGRAPSFPPGLRDAALLGGTVFDLLALEEGDEAAVTLASRLPAVGPELTLRSAFRGRSLLESELRWRRHLGELAEP
jgi:hypothetical protein